MTQNLMTVMLLLHLRVWFGLLNHLTWTHMEKGNFNHVWLPDWWCCFFKVCRFLWHLVLFVTRVQSPEAFIMVVQKEHTQVMYCCYNFL